MTLHKTKDKTHKTDRGWYLLIGIITFRVADDGGCVLVLDHTLKSTAGGRGWPDEAVMTMLSRRG